MFTLIGISSLIPSNLTSPNLTSHLISSHFISSFPMSSHHISFFPIPFHPISSLPIPSLLISPLLALLHLAFSITKCQSSTLFLMQIGTWCVQHDGQSKGNSILIINKRSFDQYPEDNKLKTQIISTERICARFKVLFKVLSNMKRTRI